MPIPLRRLLIVKTGTTAPEVRAAHGDYDRWFTDALAEHGRTFDLCDATRASIPDTSGYAGLLITGSVKSVCRPEPWMDRLVDLLRRAASGNTPPLLGVCFGGQMMAQALGGRVILSPAGWEIGAVTVDLTTEGRADPLFDGIASPMPVMATHEDRIESLPSGAVRLAGNDSASVQAFRVAARVWGVQFHPEATPAILRKLIELRRDRLLEDARRYGRPVEGQIEGLLRGLERFDPGPAGRLLYNFLATCR